MTHPAPIELAPDVRMGERALVVIAGPCVIESRELCLRVAERMREVCADLGLPYIFKASYDKANRTSLESYRGPGLEEGLRILEAVRDVQGVPLLTDVHSPEEARAAAEVVDVLQIPAFLCRQTDLIVAAAETGKPVNIKKGQFLSPWDVEPLLGKARASGNERLTITERGTSFGYRNLVVDMRGLETMRKMGVRTIFDATHSVQQPGGLGGSSGGDREMVFPLLRAACAVGVDGIFLETHPDPSRAKSDGPNSVPLELMRPMLRMARDIDELVRRALSDPE